MNRFQLVQRLLNNESITLLEQKICIVLDMSPSMSSVDHNRVLIAIAFETLAKFIHGLSRAFKQDDMVQRFNLGLS